MTQPISTTSTHSVLQLQQYLNLLSRRYPFITPVRTNGQYDQATQQAVMQFQRELHPPVTDGNVIKLSHNQFVSINRSAAVELRITMESFGTEHKQEIISALEKEGYRPKVVQTNM